MYAGDITGIVLVIIWIVSIIAGAITYPFWLKAEQQARNGLLEDGYRRAYWTTLIIIGPFAMIAFVFSLTEARKRYSTN